MFQSPSTSKWLAKPNRFSRISGRSASRRLAHREFFLARAAVPGQRKIVMHKPATNAFPIHDLIRDRWSPRAFSDKPVQPEVVASLAFQNNGKPNRNAFYDTGAASALLSVEATARGLVVHQMAGFDAEKARQVFAIPSGCEPIAAMAIGYPGDSSSLPDSLREKELAPRTRKPLSEFVMSGGWGHTASFVSK